MDTFTQVQSKSVHILLVGIDKILLIPMPLSVLLIGPILYRFLISFLCGKK